MSDVIGLKMEYDDILSGKLEDFSPVYMKKDVPQSEYIELLKYCFGEILGWSPADIKNHVSWELIKKLHLQKVLEKIDFPPELDKKQNLFYLANILYPSSASDKRTVILTVYKMVLSGESRKFPKNFFYLATGENNLFNCLNYAIHENLFFADVHAIYRFFSDKDKAIPFLTEVKLLTPCTDNYDTPLDMIHDFLPDEQKDETYYTFYKLKYKISMRGRKSAS